MSEVPNIFPREEMWKEEGSSRVPFWAYTSQVLYKKELERFFYSNHWCYVGLEAEIPNHGDFKRTYIGERSVIMVRGKDDEIFEWKMSAPIEVCVSVENDTETVRILTVPITNGTTL